MKPPIPWQGGEEVGGEKRLKGRLITSTYFYYVSQSLQTQTDYYSDVGA